MNATPPLLLAGATALGAGAWFTIRHAWWRGTVSYEEPRVLMYHMVREPLPGARFNKMRVPPALFRQQVEWLKREGWSFCFLSEIIENPGPAMKRVALTFDDGYQDNLLHAMPVLKEFGAKATLFPVVRREEGFDWSTKKKASHDSGELGAEPKLTDDEIRTMLASGLIELGGHTVTHANLPALSEDEAWQEIHGCKTALENTFGVRAPTFCYPFGLFGPREVELTRKAGFIGAVTTEQGVGSGDPFLIPRIKVSGSEGMFAFRLRIRTGRRN
jgi:peptidoglycan/xylan/chitin deacetylase (PgdA/CDA1 family)